MWKITEKLDDINWLNHTVSLVFSNSSMTNTLWWQLICNTGISVLCVHSHVFIHPFPIFQIHFPFLGPWKTSQAISYFPWVHVYSYLGVLFFSHQVSNKIHCLEPCPLGWFDLNGIVVQQSISGFHSHTELTHLWTKLGIFSLHLLAKVTFFSAQS